MYSPVHTSFHPVHACAETRAPGVSCCFEDVKSAASFSILCYIVKQSRNVRSIWSDGDIGLQIFAVFVQISAFKCNILNGFYRNMHWLWTKEITFPHPGRMIPPVLLKCLRFIPNSSFVLLFLFFYYPDFGMHIWSTFIIWDFGPCK